MGALIAFCGGLRGTAFALVAMLALGLAGVQTVRMVGAQAALAKAETAAARAETERAQAAAYAIETNRLREQELATRANAISTAYERGKTDAERTAGRVAADLRAGNQRLRGEIRALAARGVPGDPGVAGEPSDAAERGAALVGAAVGVGAQCDALQRSLIDAYDNARHAGRPGN